MGWVQADFNRYASLKKNFSTDEDTQLIARCFPMSISGDMETGKAVECVQIAGFLSRCSSKGSLCALLSTCLRLSRSFLQVARTDFILSLCFGEWKAHSNSMRICLHKPYNIAAHALVPRVTLASKSRYA